VPGPLRTLVTCAVLLALLPLALAVDRLVLRDYPVAWVYGLPALIAAGGLPPRWVALIGAAGIAAQAASVASGAVPHTLWPFFTSGVVLLAGVGVLLARSRLALEAARAEADTDRHRWAFLADATHALAGAGPDAPAVLASVAATVADAVGDGCVIRLLSDDGQWLEPAAVHHRDPAREALVRQLTAAAPLRVGEGITGQVAQTGQPLLLASTPAQIAAATKPAFAPYLHRLRTHSLLVVPLRRNGGLLGTMELGRDTTDAAYTTSELHLVQALADRAVLAVQHARLYTAAQQARADAEGALRVRDRVLAAIAHDLKNPLAVVRGRAQLLARHARRLEAADPDAAAPVALGAAQIQESALRMQRWIEELTDVAQVQAGRALPLKRRPTDLVTLAESVASAVRPGLTRHQILVHAAAPAVRGAWDAARLERVLHNLVGNAVKYSPGGGDVRLEVAQERDDAGDWAVVRVADQGIGIPAADLPHVFEAFYRSPDVGTIGGTGIGLASARDVVRHHGGRIAVESELGRGSTVTVRLPLEAPAAPPSSPSTGAPVGAGVVGAHSSG
jgi:signal transduction histidine kinase